MVVCWDEIDETLAGVGAPMLAMLVQTTLGLSLQSLQSGRLALGSSVPCAPIISMMADGDDTPTLRKPELSAAEMVAEMGDMDENSSTVRRLRPKSKLWRKAPPGREDIDEERGWGSRKGNDPMSEVEKPPQ